LEVVRRKKKPIFLKQDNPDISTVANFRNISQDELDSAVTKLRDDIENNRLDLVDSIRAYNILIYLADEQLIDNSIDDIRKLISDHVSDIHISGDQVDYSYPLHLGIDIARIKEFDESIAKVLTKKRQEIEEHKNRGHAYQQLESWEATIENVDSFRQIMEHCDGDVIFHRLEKLGNSRSFILRLSKEFKERYSSSNAGEVYFTDIGKIKTILSKIQGTTWDKLDRIDRYFIQHLGKAMAKAIQNLEKTAGNQNTSELDDSMLGK
jgi:hypothetical protein